MAGRLCDPLEARRTSFRLVLILKYEGFSFLFPKQREFSLETTREEVKLTLTPAFINLGEERTPGE